MSMKASAHLLPSPGIPLLPPPLQAEEFVEEVLRDGLEGLLGLLELRCPGCVAWLTVCGLEGYLTRRERSEAARVRGVGEGEVVGGIPPERVVVGGVGFAMPPAHLKQPRCGSGAALRHSTLRASSFVPQLSQYRALKARTAGPPSEVLVAGVWQRLSLLLLKAGVAGAVADGVTAAATCAGGVGGPSSTPSTITSDGIL